MDVPANALQAGRLDRRIVLQRKTVTRNAVGENVETWNDLTTVWASKTDVSDTERLRAAEEGSVISTRFQIRWSLAVADLNPTDQLLYAGMTYNIVGVKELGRRLGLEISAAARSEPQDLAQG